MLALTLVRLKPFVNFGAINYRKGARLRGCAKMMVGAGDDVLEAFMPSAGIASAAKEHPLHKSVVRLREPASSSKTSQGEYRFKIYLQHVHTYTRNSRWKPVCTISASVVFCTVLGFVSSSAW